MLLMVGVAGGNTRGSPISMLSYSDDNISDLLTRVPIFFNPSRIMGLEHQPLESISNVTNFSTIHSRQFLQIGGFSGTGSTGVYKVAQKVAQKRDSTYDVCILFRFA
jgi:hypothetical protein